MDSEKQATYDFLLYFSSPELKMEVLPIQQQIGLAATGSEVAGL